MNAQPLPIWKFIACITSTALAVPALHLLGWKGSTEAITLTVGALSIAFLFTRHFLRDNLRVCYRNVSPIPLALFTILAWIPFGFVIAPGIYTAILIDRQIDKAVIVLEEKINGTIEIEHKEILKIISEDAGRWYWPPSWGTFVERKVIETIDETIYHPAKLSVLFLFIAVSWVMLAFQFIFYASLVFILVKSLMLIGARCAIKNGAEIEFTLP